MAVRHTATKGLYVEKGLRMVSSSKGDKDGSNGV